MCFDPAGLLFREFDLIFEDTFSKRAGIYRRIVETLVAGSRNLLGICEGIGVAPSGVTSEYLGDLELSGFIARDFVLNNLTAVLEKLNIPMASVVSASPYFQNTTRRQQACQIDLLIQTRSALFVCEIKFRKRIGVGVMSEVAKKISRLVYPRHLSIRPVLIYLGELSPHVEDECYFDRILSLDRLL